MMRLYFLRHGEARPPDWKGPDDERPLTKAGRKEVHEVAEFLLRLKAKVDVILTSPLPRAAQTADIAAEHFKVRVREERLLSPGFRSEDLKRILRKYPAQVLMLVGHEPDFSEVVEAVSGGDVKISKAGVALLDLDGSEGKLLWLFPPRLAKK
jgi:phosphohistidine phosphatase